VQRPIPIILPTGSFIEGGNDLTANTNVCKEHQSDQQANSKQ